MYYCKIKDHFHLYLQGLMNCLRDFKDVGYLQIKLIKATDLQSTDLSGTYLY